jgi:hypothetical protein
MPRTKLPDFTAENKPLPKNKKELVLFLHSNGYERRAIAEKISRATDILPNGGIKSAHFYDKPSFDESKQEHRRMLTFVNEVLDGEK